METIGEWSEYKRVMQECSDPSISLYISGACQMFEALYDLGYIERENAADAWEDVRCAMDVYISDMVRNNK